MSSEDIERSKIGPPKDGVMVEKKTELVPVSDTRAKLPPILVGRVTPAVEAQVGSFYGSVAEIFERWITRRSSKHTQRAYRQDVMDFIQSFPGLLLRPATSFPDWGHR